jgi:uncharacterized membrane protein YphA (DoxX/SURF4 family)
MQQWRATHGASKKRSYAEESHDYGSGQRLMKDRGTGLRGGTPGWVSAVMEWPGLLLWARVGLVSAYLAGGIEKLSDYSAAVAEQAHFGLQPAWVWAALALTMELSGSLLIIFNRLVWLASGGLSVLTLIAAFVAENFWALQGHARFVAFNSFLERIGLIAAFVLVAWISNARPRANS